jgi:hypothetical protein
VGELAVASLGLSLRDVFFCSASPLLGVAFALLGFCAWLEKN